MACVDPLFFGEEGVEVGLDFFRRRFVGKADFTAQSQHVRVDDKSGRDSKRVSQNAVRRFAADAGQFAQLLEIVGDLSAVLFHERLGRA